MRASTNLDQIRLPNNHNQPLYQPQPGQQMSINQQQLIEGMNNMSLGGSSVQQNNFIPSNVINARGVPSGGNPSINLAFAANGSQNIVMPQQNQYYNAGAQQHQVPQMHANGYYQNIMPHNLIAPQQQQQNKSMTSRAGDQQHYNGSISRPHSAFNNHSNADISLQNDIWAPVSSNQSTQLQGINRRLFSSPAPQSQYQQNQAPHSNQHLPQQVNSAACASLNFNNEEPIKQQSLAAVMETANADSIFSRPPCEGFGTETLTNQLSSLQGQTVPQQLSDERYLSNGMFGAKQQQKPANQISQMEAFNYFGGQQPQQTPYLQGINAHHHAQSQQVLLIPQSSTQPSGMQGQSSEVFSANVGNSGSITQRSATSFRTGPRQKSNEVMIHNIDKATISFIAQELHQQDVLDISQSLVSRNILIVRFQSCEGAQWAINRYDGQTINQRELRVTIAVDGPHRNRKREVKWESTNLAKITETADVDEDVEQESSAENINTAGYSSPQQQIVNGQVPLENNIQSKAQKNTNQNGVYMNAESQSKSQAAQTLVGQNVFSDQGFIPLNRQTKLNAGAHLQNSLTPPPGLTRMEQQMATSQGLGFHPGYMMQSNQIQQHAMLQRGYPGNNYDKMMMQQQMQQQRFYQNGSQLMPNSQPLQFATQQRQMISQTGFYPDAHNQFQNQAGNPYHSQQVGSGPQQFQPNHYMTQTLSHQDFMINSSAPGQNSFQNQTAHMTLDPASLQKASGIDPKEVPGMLGLSGHSRSSSTLEPLPLGQDLSSHFKDQNFQQPQQQFGFAPLQHLLHIGDISQFNQLMGMPQNFSSSIETSQQDEIENLSSQNINFPENHGSGSDRESFIFKNTRLSMTTRNIMIPNSTRNSDSDSSQKFNKLHFHQTQQFQSPESRRRAMQQIYQESSFEYHRNPASNSGHDTPPFLTPAQNKHLNNSFNLMNGGGNSSQGQSQTLFVNEAQQRITHNRNLSLNSQLPSQLLNQDATTQFFMQQHGHHQTQFYISSGGHHQLMSNLNCASSSSDLNDVNNFYPMQQFQGGGAFLPHQTAASQLGPELHKLASADFDNHSVVLPKHKKKGGGGNGSSGGGGVQGGPQNKSYQSHKSLKYQAYSEFSLTSDQSMYELDLEKIKRNEDTRTTVMIKHIPNKYNQRLLLQEINKNHQGKYDFFYLPIDYQNLANVGYAFVNFVHHYMILDFHKEFQGRKWAMFNSKKKCDIKYGRIQGLEGLKQHFHLSSVMNQNDENYRPRIFEQHNKMDWTAELKKIIEKHKIQSPMFHKCGPGANIQSQQSLLNLQQQQSNITSNQSQGSHAQGSHHNRQQSIGGSSSNNPQTNSASQAALSTQKLIEASAEEEEEKEEP